MSCNTINASLAILDNTRNALHQRKPRSAWAKGVVTYADNMIDTLAQAVRDGYAAITCTTSADDLCRWALNGARDWREYSWGGCALIYNSDIAATLCTPSELRRTRNGERRPNNCEQWLDTQARALCQAFAALLNAFHIATRREYLGDPAIDDPIAPASTATLDRDSGVIRW